MMTAGTPRAEYESLAAPFKHYDNGNGYEYCSGRIGWPRRKTTDMSQVTCRNCMRQLARAAKQES